MPAIDIKKCQPEGSLKLNDECREDKNCGTYNNIQMKCLEADVVIRATNDQLGFSSSQALKGLRHDIVQ